MFFEFVKNFAILFSFTVLIFWPFIHYSNKQFIMKYKAIIAGVTFGIVAIILTLVTYSFADGVLINSRTILLVFGGLLGGPTTIIITGLMIAISRYVFHFTSSLSFFMMVNGLIITAGTAYAASKWPITYRTITPYFILITFEQTIILLLYNRCSLQSIWNVSIYIIFSFMAFAAIYTILNKLQHTSDQIKQMYALGETDFLTQLPNAVALEKMVHFLIQTKTPFEILHLDLRKFQDVNVHDGYQTGDQLLTQVSHVLTDQLLNTSAFLFRAGSDEFFILLPSKTPAHSITFAHDIYLALQEQTFHVKKETYIRLSVAIGISSYPQNGETMHQLYSCSIKALTNAKSAEVIPIVHANQIHTNVTSLS